MKTEILQISEKSIDLADKLLKGGSIVGMPTETVYGLAAIGTLSQAVEEIYRVKGRPSDNPLIAHIHKGYDINKLVYKEQAYADKLIKAYMPGPLTLVFYSKGVVCKEATAGGDTLAVRMPSHLGCQQLLRKVNEPIVAPSANLSKHTSPVTAMHVFNDLNGKIPLILDGGKCTGGIESTVLDVTEKVPRILRAGLITREMIALIAGDCEVANNNETEKVRSPGVKYRHYRPKCDTALFKESEIDKAKVLYEALTAQGKVPYIMCEDRVAQYFKGCNILNLGKDGLEIAASLYDKLLEGEKKADEIIAIEMPREDGVFLGILNRLRKSCC